MAYLAGVAIYLVALQVLNYQAKQVRNEVAGLANTYTNVLRLKERVQVLQEQLNLKYASLDCWKVASEHLPADFTLINLQFGRGGTLQLIGTAPEGQRDKVLDYNEALAAVEVDGKRLFREVTPPTFPSRTGSQLVNWNFTCTLNIDAAL